MNKEKFLTNLRKRLSVLEDSEIEDIISEYEGYIDEKVNSGLTEEEAVKELGNIDEIVSDLLSAYKVKEPKNDSFNNIINIISNGIDNFISSLDNKSARDIIRILIEIIIILLAIWVLKIPFALIRDLGENIFYEFSNPIGNILGSIWYILIEASYIIIAIIFFFKMFEKRYFKSVSTKIIDEVEDEYKKDKEEDKKRKKTKKKESIDETKESKESSIPETKKVQKIIVKDHTFVDTLTDICIFILKFFALIFIVGAIFYLVGISIALGFMIYLICKGVTYIGILILLIALFTGGAFVLEFLINFLFNKKNKAYKIFSSLIVCIILLAVGLTMSAIEISNTEIIYDNSNFKMKTTTKEIPINSSYMPIYYYDNLIIDNNLNNTIKIEYSYPNISDLNIDIELEKYGSGYFLHSDIKHFSWNKEILNYLIDNLKDKKIYTYDFRIIKNVYVNETDINKIKVTKEPQIFTRIYKVLDVIDSNEEYIYLTLEDGETIENVKILKSLIENIEPNNTYEFTFSTTNDFDDDINEIFQDCKLLKITKFGDISLY